MAAITDSISAKVKPEEKTQFVEVCDAIGTSPSNAIRMFIAAFNRRGGFPFDPANPYGFNQETLQAMDDAVTGHNVSETFHSMDALVASLEESTI